jgi:hypothetical protein
MPPGNFHSFRDTTSFVLEAQEVRFGLCLSFTASLPSDPFGATVKLCKCRYLRIADLGGWCSMVGR